MPGRSATYAGFSLVVVVVVVRVFVFMGGTCLRRVCMCMCIFFVCVCYVCFVCVLVLFVAPVFVSQVYVLFYLFIYFFILWLSACACVSCFREFIICPIRENFCSLLSGRTGAAARRRCGTCWCYVRV